MFQMVRSQMELMIKDHFKIALLLIQQLSIMEYSILLFQMVEQSMALLQIALILLDNLKMLSFKMEY